MEINGKQVIVIYAGRFQPMGKHHKMTYDWCVQNFGTENIFIVSSDKVEMPKSPLNFIEKQAVASAHGVPVDKFVNEKVPYALRTWKNIPNALSNRNLDYNNVILAFVVGKKDMEGSPRFRVGMTKKGTPTYFQHFDPNIAMRPGIEHGYLLVAPHMEYLLPNGMESSGTNLREFLANASPNEFELALGFWDEDLDNLFKEKFVSGMLSEGIERRNRNDKGYSSYLEEIMNELQHIKKEYGSRTKEGEQYRKEASKIQDAYSEIRRLKRKHERQFSDEAMLSERVIKRATGHDDYEDDSNKPFNRDAIREFFNKFK
jgi:hypothetical protein